jgi:hypothetical protein
MDMKTDKRTRAERIFKSRGTRDVDGPKSVKDYYAAQQAVIERTHKLREARLAREAAQKRAR